MVLKAANRRMEWDSLTCLPQNCPGLQVHSLNTVIETAAKF